MSYLSGAGTGAQAGLSGGANGLGNSLTFGTVVDGVYTSGASGNASTGSAIELTTGWTAGGAIEHLWNPQLKTSVYGGYNKYTYSDTAANYMCNGSFSTSWARGTAAGSHAPVLNGVTSTLSGCDPNLSYWTVGTRTQWNPNSNLDLGVDVAWNRLNSSNSGTYFTNAAFGGRPNNSAYNLASNYDVITAAIRAQYNFLP
jgi:hypothetical protein